MDRKDVLNSSEYWTSKTQIELYNQAQKFMEATGKDRAHLAEYLGVSKGLSFHALKPKNAFFLYRRLFVHCFSKLY